MSAKPQARKRRCGGLWQPLGLTGPRSDGRSDRRSHPRSQRRSGDENEVLLICRSFIGPLSLQSEKPQKWTPLDLTRQSISCLIPPCRTRRRNPSRDWVSLPRGGSRSRTENEVPMYNRAPNSESGPPLYSRLRICGFGCAATSRTSRRASPARQSTRRALPRSPSRCPRSGWHGLARLARACPS